MGTHGRTGLTQLLMGNTADGVLRDCPVPVLTVRRATARAPKTWPFTRVLVAVDDSEPADAAVALALDLAAGHPTRLQFCSVVATADLLGKAATYGYDPRPMLTQLHIAANDLLDGPLGKSRARDINADTNVLEGDAFVKIVEAATAMNADLIIAGSHGRRGIRRLFLGSVAENIVRTSNVPVLTIRTQAARAARPLQPAAQPSRV
jgi:nucleotide-binding universal stress UspA family protein